MAIVLKPIQRVNPRDTTGERKWYPIQKTLELVDENQVAEDIAEETTLNPSEALMVIRQLEKVVVEHLLDSKSVKLGDWGRFSIGLNTTAADSKEALSVSNVSQVNIRFTPGDAVKEALADAKFSWIEKDSDSEE